MTPSEKFSELVATAADTRAGGIRTALLPVNDEVSGGGRSPADATDETTLEEVPRGDRFEDPSWAVVVAGLLLLAAGFAFVNGMNDGGSLTSTGIKLPGIQPLAAIAMLTLSVVAAPLLFGTAVATTLAIRLVQFEAESAELALTLAVIVAVGVVLVLSRWGLPTSLTLAVVGAITGAGLGSGSSVSWRWVAGVLVLAAVAPLVGAMLALTLTRLAYAWTPLVRMPAFLRQAHRAAFSLQCLAYGVNDGQKMLAVFALALASSTDPVGLPGWAMTLLAVCFALGTAIGLRRYGGTLGGGVMPVRPTNAVIAEVSSGVTVLSTGLLGAPVSMTQAIAGGLIGTGAHEGIRRIRWNQALKIVAAWVVTLPVALAAATVLVAMVVAV
jgi:inorganic phosphate transporter, PiT family